MSLPILATKLYIPPLRSEIIHRLRLIEQLNQGLHRKFTLISALQTLLSSIGKEILTIHQTPQPFSIDFSNNFTLMQDNSFCPYKA